MSFREGLEKESLAGGFNETLTDNGAVGFARTKSAILDANFKITEYRDKPDAELQADFLKMYTEDPELATKFLFYARDAREGLGEKRLFGVMFSQLLELDKRATKLIPCIPDYGYYKDLNRFIERPDVQAFLKYQIDFDFASMSKNLPVSLCAKWLPSINGSWQTGRQLARILARAWGWTERKYRKTLVALRAYLKVIEPLMTSGRWGEINYQAVPSRANVLYRKAFLKHDEERRKDYLAKLEKGEVKINSAVNFPHEIVSAYFKDLSFNGWDTPTYKASLIDQSLEALWKALPRYSLTNTVVVADGSGSMTSQIQKGLSVTAWQVAHSLAIYFSQYLEGEFKDAYITFSQKPQLVKLDKASSLLHKLFLSMAHAECDNTNIEAVFDLILKTAVNGKLQQDQLPATVLVISDMAFDSCTTDSSHRGRGLGPKLFEVIAKRFADAGYKLPRLVFWNVSSGAKGAIPVIENEQGVALVSGFSANTVKMALSSQLDPYLMLLDVLKSERYAPITLGIEEVKS